MRGPLVRAPFPRAGAGDAQDFFRGGDAGWRVGRRGQLSYVSSGVCRVRPGVTRSGPAIWLLAIGGMAARMGLMRLLPVRSCLRWTVRVLPVVLFTVIACEYTGPPVIGSLEGESAVAAGDSALYECRAWDQGEWDQNPIEYTWDATRGLIVPARESYARSQAMWYAPESSGKGWVKVRVSDSEGFVTSDSIAVETRKRTVSSLAVYGAVKAGQYRVWHDSLRFSHLARGWVSVDTNDVSFRILDLPNYDLWQSGGQYEALLELERVEEDSIIVDVVTTGSYHLVLDNRHGKIEKQFTLRFVVKTP